MRKYQRIRNLREDKDMNQTQMARELNINQRTYSRYEKEIFCSEGGAIRCADCPCHGIELCGYVDSTSGWDTGSEAGSGQSGSISCAVYDDSQRGFTDFYGENTAGKYYLWKWFCISVQYGWWNFKLSGDVYLPEKGFFAPGRGQYCRWDCT